MATPDADKLLQRLGHRFRRPGHFRQALTHKSWVNEHPEEPPLHNERMEFLGDAVLDFVVTDRIVDTFPDLSEGELSKMRASLVSEPSLAGIARELGLGPHLRLGRGEERSGGREKDSLLSDALEAVVAAVYLDSRAADGTATVYAVVERLFGQRIAHAAGAVHTSDYKTALQELVQRAVRVPVTYRVMSEEGPDHRKTYEVAVLVGEREYGRGRGRSKKESEQAAARNALLSFSGERAAAE